MKLLRETLVIALAVLSSACANPGNWLTSNRYSKVCVECEQRGRLIVAEEACYRALMNVYWGNLSDSVKSERMYEFARIERQLRKFDEAERFLKASLALEEESTPVSQEKIGRRAAELAIVYESTGRLVEGLPYVERLFPLADIYRGKERRTVAAIFYLYSQNLPEQISSDVRTRLEQKALAMGFDPKAYFDHVKVVYYTRDARAAHTAREIGEWTKAFEYSARAYQEARAANAPDSTLAVALYEYGRSAGTVCKFTEAESALLEAAKLEQKTNGPVFMSTLELARLNLDQGKWAQASNYFEETLAELDKVQAKFRNPHEYANILEEYALARRHLIDEAQADELEAEAAELRALAPRWSPTSERTPYGTQCRMFSLIGFSG